MNFDEAEVKKIDEWWRDKGFSNRTEFIKFAISSVMQTHNDDSYILVQEAYYQWLMKTIMEKVSIDIASKINFDQIRKELFAHVFKGTLKKLIEQENNNESTL
jgi:Arc/MetJ-type ribon-helix-helix transcriptional regulator